MAGVPRNAIGSLMRLCPTYMHDYSLSTAVVFNSVEVKQASKLNIW